MRGILLAMLVAAGIGLAGSAGVSAAPINGAVDQRCGECASPVEPCSTGVGVGRTLALWQPWWRSLALGQPRRSPAVPPSVLEPDGPLLVARSADDV